MRLILCSLLFLTVLHSQSKSDLATQRLLDLQAQHQRDMDTIKRLVKEKEAATTSTNTVTAIGKLSKENNVRGAVAETHAQQAQQAVEQIHSAAESMLTSADVSSSNSESTKLEIAKLRASMPVNSVPVWLAAISGMVAVIGTLGSVVIALGTRQKVGETAKVQEQKLGVLHGMLNSEKTAELQRLLLSNRANLVLLIELTDLKISLGKAPSKNTAGMIEAAKKKIVELEMELEERERQDTIAARM